MRNPENIHPKTLPNRKCPDKTSEEQVAAQLEALEAQMKALSAMLPTILAKFARIKDPRRPGSVRHKLTVVLFFGILLFVMQCASRREANEKITEPSVLEKIQMFFPEINSIPHMDTVERMLEKVPAEEAEATLQQLIQKLIKNKKLQSLMQDKGYIVAIDGTGKHSGDNSYDGKALYRTNKDGTKRYIVYVLEATLVSPQGISLPLMAEFCENQEEFDKQDCELKAFYRLAVRIKKLFPKQRLVIVADSLYPSGPTILLCRKNKWDFMIVLKSGRLPSVWADAKGIMKLTKAKDSKTNKWGNGDQARDQLFQWANDIIYDWKDSESHNHHTKIHVVVSYETWREKGKDGILRTKNGTWAWVSDKAITTKNVVKRCNLIGRSRWGIESNFNAEKNQGYCFESVLSKDWNAMKGWHALMRLAHVLNTITLHTKDLWTIVTIKGIRATLEFLSKTLRNPCLDIVMLRKLSEKRTQLRLVI